MDPEVWRVQEGKWMCFCWWFNHYTLSDFTPWRCGRHHHCCYWQISFQWQILNEMPTGCCYQPSDGISAVLSVQWKSMGSKNIYIGLHWLLLCGCKNQWEHFHFWGNYVFASLPCLKSSLREAFDCVSSCVAISQSALSWWHFPAAFIAQVIGSQKNK